MTAKVVHAVAHRKHYRNWMTRVAVAIPWITGACTYLLPTIAATRVRQGRCIKFSAWSKQFPKEVDLICVFNDRIKLLPMALLTRVNGPS